ncbi:MAG TPA: BamA/TamA family outer membrane protein [Puia sp.]|uniref:BamA/TamA family outer membrane protein n=1 Tax=Puia sp. TaxID=2045100 RepID=UPI002CDDBE0B|nr:BamA/TamA family outer membrane protein [Puia sp.]HVU98586.1 BamA/TamA family outer membrane protein [Puia sp.]
MIMRARLITLFVFIASVSSFGQQRERIPLDTVPAHPAIKNKNLLAFPFAVRSLETDWGFGGIAARFFKAKDTTIRTSDINLLGLYTLRSQLILVLSSTIFFPKEDHIARFQASYSYYPDDFWGLGNHTSFQDKEGFSQKQFFINPQFLKRIHGNLYLGVTYEFQHTGPVSYTPGGVFDKQSIPGRHGGNTSGIGPILSWDTRNNAYSPDRGAFAEIQFEYFDQHLGSDFNFRLLSVDLRKFIHLSDKEVFALQGLGGFTFGETPFRKLEELGGADMMRGYYGGRFTDKCLMAYQAEYRRFLFWRLGAVAFASTGEVASTPRKFELDGFHFAYGGGVRFALSKEEKLNLRVDYGIAKHSNAFTVQLREAF